MQEAAKLFAGIFVNIIAVIAMRKAGANGSCGAIVAGITRPDGSPDLAMYFRATGLLSSFVDSAPTPSFFSCLAWCFSILIPLFIIMTFFWFR